ncbi:MAG: hypothetical protein ABL997_10155 [Planctomycetota bacterium]
MEARSRVVVLAAVFSALTFAAWLWLDRDASAEGIATPSEFPATTPVEAANAERPVEAKASVAADGGPTEDTAPPARTMAPTIDPRLATLRGRCVDEHGTPLAGCTATMRGFRANAQRMDAWRKDHAAEPEWEDPPEFTTSADGVFAFTFLPPPPFQFALDLSQRGRGNMSGRWSTLAEGSIEDVGDVAMLPGVHVRGRVVDEQGTPQAKEQVTLQRARAGRPGADVEPRWDTVEGSAADGTFSMNHWLLPGEYSIRTANADVQTPKAVKLTVERSEEVLEVVVRARAIHPSITGRVVDETGSPVRGIKVEDRSAEGRASTSSRRDGTFDLRQHGTSTAKHAALVLVSDTHEVDPTPREVAWSSSDVEFRVRRAPSFTLRVTDAAGAPLDMYLVRLIPRNRSRWSSRDNEARAWGVHEDGTVVVPGLARGDWLLMVEPPTDRGLCIAFLEFTQRGDPTRLDLQIEPLLRRTLRVLAADGPVAGTRIRLCDTFGQTLTDARPEMNLEQWLASAGQRNALSVFEGTTDAEGRLVLQGPRGRELSLSVLGPGHVPLQQAPVRLDVAEELVVHIDRGATLTGKVVPPEALEHLKRMAGGGPGTPFPARYAPTLSLTNDRGEVFPKDRSSTEGKQDFRIAADGTFRVEGLPPGTWRVQVNYWIVRENGAGGGAHPTEVVTLVESAATTLELDLTAFVPGEVEGSVHWNGQPFANSTLHLDGQRMSYDVTTDASGRFRVHPLPGTYEAVIQKKLEGLEWSELVCTTPVHATRGQRTTIGLVFESGTLQAKVLDTKGDPARGVLIHAPRAGRRDTVVRTDENGVARFELNTGNVDLRIVPKSLSSQEAQQKLWTDARGGGVADPLAPHWIVLQSVTLTAGQVAELELQLPESAGY